MDLAILAPGTTPASQQVSRLYESVGWSAYTGDLESLLAGLAGSRTVVTAFHQGELVGLARIVGDGHTVAYLQDVLVSPTWQRKGLGSRLVRAAFAEHDGVRQQVLLTDLGPQQRAFYLSLGFAEVGTADVPLRCFVRFANQPEITQ